MSESLFDERSLAGWRPLGPDVFRDVNGVIEGVSVPGAPTTSSAPSGRSRISTSLSSCSIDSGFNSGIQFHSRLTTAPLTAVWHYGNGRPRERTWPAGTVVGYQAELDRRPELVGVVLEDVGRGFFDLTPATAGFQARLAPSVVQPDWNHLRIRAVGDTIDTWVNGQPVAQLRDHAHATGFLMSVAPLAVRRRASAEPMPLVAANTTYDGALVMSCEWRRTPRGSRTGLAPEGRPSWRRP